jgi:serine/threonine-protein kinase
MIDPPEIPDLTTIPIVPRGRYDRGDWIEDEYEIEALVDEHPFGEIYNARDADGARVRIKFYFGFARPEAHNALRFELKIDRMQHPNILPFVYAGPDANQFYMVMPLCEHGTLADWLRTRPEFHREDAFAILLQLAFALYFLHEHDIVHCDLNPSTIAVAMTAPMTIKIHDFARARFDRCELRPRRDIRCWQFAAPEYRSQRAIASRAADIFSIAAIGHLALTGHHLSLREGTREYDLRQIAEYYPELAQFLTRMLSNDPGRRPTALEVMRFMDPIVRNNRLVPPRERQITK